MTRYEMVRKTVEVPFEERFQIKKGFSLEIPNCFEKTVGRFTKLEKAKEELSKTESVIALKTSSRKGSTFFVDEFFLEEAVYDRCGYLISFKVIAVADMKIKIMERGQDSIIKECSSLEEAEKSLKNYDNCYLAYKAWVKRT